MAATPGPHAFGFDAFAPAQIAERVNELGVAKARLPILSTLMLGGLAGAFIGLGALFFVLVQSDASLGFAARRVLGGTVFALGLLLVVVAGAELFTGNNLLAMAWADGKLTTLQVLRNWMLVGAANFAGAVGLALVVWLSADALPDWALVRNLVPVIAGNLVGGSVLVALVYHVIYLRPKRLQPALLEPGHDATRDHPKEPAR